MRKKIKYINHNSQKNIIIVVCSIISVLLIISIILSNMDEKESLENEITNISGMFKSVKDVLDYYDCTYINEIDSKENGYEVDINLIFKYSLYENDESNEDFYNKVLKATAKVLNYKNFRMIDKENDVNIEVTCVEKTVDSIRINGIEDYFIYMDSQIGLKKYKAIPNTESILIESDQLRRVVKDGWSSNIDLGLRDSIFKNYYIYFNQGMEVRRINGKIYNIVFTKKYTDTVVNGITVGTEFDLIKRNLGTPSFQNADGQVIGYKNQNIYIFFSKDQISVYRRDKNDYTDFFKLIDQFLNDEKDLMEFMNDLTYLWPDYSEYSYDSTYFFISYPLKGLEIKYNYENTSGIIVYNNFDVTQSQINSYLENTEFISKLQIDNVYETELRRIEERANLLAMCNNYTNEKEIQENPGKSDSFNYYMDLDDNRNIITAYFVSKDGQHANSEINENIYTYTWMGNDYFIYSIKNKGIYYYNVADRVKGSIISGNSEYKIKGFENGILKYDDAELKVNY